MKGQHGYGILAPVTARFASSEPGGRGLLAPPRAAARSRVSGETVKSKLIGLKPTHVWDVSQTAGDPVPELPRPNLLQGQAPAGLWDGLADQITAAGFELRLVSSAAAIGGANGLTDFLVPRGLGPDGHGRRRPGEDARPRTRTRPAPRSSRERDVARNWPPTRPCTAGSPRSKPSRSH